MSHSTAEAGELSPRDPVEGRGHRQVAPVEGKTANTPRLGPVSTSRQRIAELARQALGMAVAIAWLPGPAGTRRRVAKPSVEEPDAAEPARPDLWGARVSNDPGLPDHEELQHVGKRRHTRRAEQRLSAVTNVATRRASSVESARRTASIGFLDSTTLTLVSNAGAHTIPDSYLHGDIYEGEIEDVVRVPNQPATDERSLVRRVIVLAPAVGVMVGTADLDA